MKPARRWILTVSACAGIGMLVFSGCDDGDSKPADGAADGSNGNAGATVDDAASDVATTDAGIGGAQDVGDSDAGGDDGPEDAANEPSKFVGTMFLPDSLSNTVYRYIIKPGADPIQTASIMLDKAGAVAISPTGELFVSAYDATGIITRFLTPLRTPTAHGTISDLGISYPEEIQFVDNELWVPNTALHACTSEQQNIVRVAFDAQGTASVAGIVTDGLKGANRGVLWVPDTRDLYVSQCQPVNTILHFRVGLDHTATTMPPITGLGISNPHAMVMTSWGELLIVNAGDSTILRLKVDAQGAATANGSIAGPAGKELSLPVGLALTPWGELIVVNQNNATLSRFSFDSNHVAVPSGTFATNTPSEGGQYGIGWVVITPGE